MQGRGLRIEAKRSYWQVEAKREQGSSEGVQGKV